MQKEKASSSKNCVFEQANSKMLQHVKEKNEFHLIFFGSTNDLIAAEAQYHPPCYTDYTRRVTSKK